MSSVVRRRRPALGGPLRSMRWLRRAGMAYRVRAAILLIAFAIGSIFARDALLVQQTALLRAEAQRDWVPEDFPAIDQAPKKLTVRPSGISRRAAMNPWDPPDDDDELDQDSDTVAAAHAVLAVLPPLRGEVAESPYVTTSARPCTLAVRPRPDSTRNVSSRGPPV
jgi:hypothetical protein